MCGVRNCRTLEQPEGTQGTAGSRVSDCWGRTRLPAQPSSQASRSPRQHPFPFAGHQPGNTYFTIFTLYLKILQWLSYFYDRIKSKLSPACEAFRSPSSAYWIPLSSAIPPSLSQGLTTRNLLSCCDPAKPDVMTAFALAPPPNRSTRIAVATLHEWVFALIFFYNGSKILLYPCCGMFYLELPLYMPVFNSSLQHFEIGQCFTRLHRVPNNNKMIASFRVSPMPQAPC